MIKGTNSESEVKTGNNRFLHKILDNTRTHIFNIMTYTYIQNIYKIITLRLRGSYIYIRWFLNYSAIAVMGVGNFLIFMLYLSLRVTNPLENVKKISELSRPSLLI